MRMSPDYFATLGLSAEPHTPVEVARRFRAERQDTLNDLDNPAGHTAARRRLYDLYAAFHTLSDPQRQAEYLRSLDEGEDRLSAMRRMIEASLEGGLLRHSRRQDLLYEGRRLGFSEFHTQLLIAQVQFGDTELMPLPKRRKPPVDAPVARVGARVAAAGVLALAMFLATVRWLSA